MKIVLGVTGGIAAYKAVFIARQLIESGHEVHVVPTDDALKFVGKPTWEAISRNTVTTSVHEDVPEVRHVALGQKADLIIVAPATANTIAKMVAGLADDLLGTTLLASRAPVVVAPAMHTEMWQHASTQHNITVLKERGVHVVGPDSGRLTGDDSGPGRMSEPRVIVAEALAFKSGSRSATIPQDLAGKRVLVTAGGTREPIDPVRFIGNRSSGKQGVAVALAAARRGARVQLVAANVSADVLGSAAGDPLIDIERVSTTSELQAATERAAAGCDVVCMVAAVADYRVAEVSDEKRRKEDAESEQMTLRLIENPDILRGLVEAREREPERAGQIIVGFAAETGADQAEVLARGKRKVARKGADMLAVNTVSWSEGFETEDNSLIVLDGSGEVLVETSGPKTLVAEALIEEVANALQVI